MKTLLHWMVAAVILGSVAVSFSAGPEKDGAPALGVNADLHGKPVFPPADPWNTDISKEPIDPNSDVLIASIGLKKALHPDFGTTYNGRPSGIPYVVVDGKQPKVPVTFEYADESDAGPYPIPPDAPIEGGADAKGDRHVLVIDRDNWVLYELFASTPVDGGKSWRAASGAIFDLTKNTTRPATWTSADAAGLPVFAGLARYDEIALRKELTHALRFTVTKSRKAYVAPARHWAARSEDPKLPPMGMRVRLKADYDVSKFPETARVVLNGLKKYGMILADNGGDWFVSGAPDPRWNDEELGTLKRVKGGDFEAVKMGDVMTRHSAR